jgi:hypothetical protein
MRYFSYACNMDAQGANPPQERVRRPGRIPLPCEHPSMERSTLPIVEVMRVIAGHGLPGKHRETAVGELPDRVWPHLLRLLSRQRISGIALAAHRDGSLRLTEEQRADLVQSQRAAMGMVLVLEQLLLDASEALAAAGIPTIVLKGAAWATTFYPDPTWRAYGDLDLLVPTSYLVATSRALAELGFTRSLPEPKPGFDERFGKGVSLADSSGRQVDVHRTLALAPFGLWIDTVALVQGTTPFLFRGKSLRRLDDTNAMLHACIHAALGWEEPLVVPLRDVLQIAWSGRVDWELLERRARAWRLVAPVAHALRTASGRLGVPIPEPAEVVMRSPIRWTERRALAAYTTDRRRRGGMSLAALWAIPGLSSRVVYVRALLFPDRRFLEARAAAGTGTVGRRLLVPLRWAWDRLRSWRGGSARSNRKV